MRRARVTALNALIRPVRQNIFERRMSASSVTTPAKAAEILLKVTPSRAPVHLLSRARLAVSSQALRGYPILLVQAPAGFGKTSLLAQWRREHQAHGAAVAWVSAEAVDDPQRFVEALLLAVRQGTGRPNFGRSMRESQHAPLDRATSWLAEVAQGAMDIVLFVDDAERLPAQTSDVLVYVLRNAPPNLRVVVAARPELSLGIEDLSEYGQCKVVGASLLRFQLPETISLIDSRFGARIEADKAARLHELVEGWPLGLQLVLAAISTSDNPGADLALLNARQDLRQQAVAMLLSNLGPRDVDFLVSISIVDLLRPELCRAIVDESDAADRLARLVSDTPIFTADERGGWLRMHQLLRDALDARFAALPSDRQLQAHARAAIWLADNNLLEAAARHALASGQRTYAYDLAERSLYRDLMQRGRLGAVSDWLGRLPDEEVDRRPRLLLAAAWAQATSGRHAEGARLVQRILAQGNVDEAVRCECTLILASGTFYSDDPDRFSELVTSMGDNPPLTDPVLKQFVACQVAMQTLLAGEAALSRMQAQKVVDGAGATSYPGRWAQCVIGLSYLREGQVTFAESQFRTTLSAAETDFGRRGQFTCMVAALLAATLWELNRTEEAATVLSDRLAVLEQSGSVETLVLAYRTLARNTLAQGVEHRALEALEALHAVGQARALPSICIMSLVEQIRVHARRFRTETCQALLDRLSEVLELHRRNHGAIWLRAMEAQRCLGRVYAAIAAQQWRSALVPIAEGSSLARESQNRLMQMEFLALKALCRDRCGEDARALLRESADLAQSLGVRRLFADIHPHLAALAQQADLGSDAGGSLLAAAPGGGPPPPQPRVRTVPSMVLTPREREVLEHLAHNLSNKEIALAMEVGEQAIKWHVKNLFSKLDAGTRKQVVQRARILGLLEGED
jgi:LuxR family transcriptional regulator, maltose regulon positive regulatory protein